MSEINSKTITTDNIIEKSSENDESEINRKETIRSGSSEGLPTPQIGGSGLKSSTSTSSIASSKTSGIKPPTVSRIGRPCQVHSAPKAGPPPSEPKSKILTFFIRLSLTQNTVVYKH